MSATKCPGCGAGIDQDSRFCGGCGRILQSSGNPGTPATAGRPGWNDGPTHTVMGLPAEEALALAAAAEAAAATGAAPAADATANAAAVAADAAAHTIMGLPSPSTVPETGARGAKVGAADPTARTMLGLQLDVEQLEAEARKRASALPAEQTPPVPVAVQSAPAAAARAPASSASAPAASRTSLAPDPSDLSGSDISSTSVVLGRRRGASTGLIVVLMILGLAALGAAIWVGWRVVGARGGAGGGDRLQAAVSRSPAGDVAWLDLSLTPFTPGAQVELLGQRQPLDAGHARFSIPMQSLAVGPNDLPARILDASGEQLEHIRVVLSYRVRPDLEGLRAPTPTYALVFETVPAARVEVDGVALAPDPQGRLVHTVPLAAAVGQGTEHTVRFRVIAPPAAPEEGTVTTRLPVSTLTVDRPADGAVIEADSIECAGAVDPSAVVTINGQAVVVTGDRFLHRVALPERKDYVLEIVATTGGKAPQTRRLSIRRVESIQAEVAAFTRTVDRSLNYARVSENPSIYNGQAASFFGKIFNARIENGTTTLQILVRDCPAGLRCSLWVTYQGEAAAQNGDWVDVHGTLAGSQSYQTTRGEALTVPKLAARFVVRRNP